MKDFKNSTKTQYMKGGSCDAYAKGGSVKGAAKISKVMGEFKRGELHSGSKKGAEVTNPKQATAIALSEARKAGAKIPQPVQKKSLGGILKAMSPVAALASSDVGQKIMGSGALGLGGLALSALMKKKQAGTITPAEDKQLAAQQAAAPQAAMKTGGKVMKKGDGGAVARGNRMQALEGKEEAKLMREPRKAAMADADRARASKAVPVASREPKIRNPLMDRLTQLPSQRGEFPVRKAGGGLAAMPKGKNR